MSFRLMTLSFAAFTFLNYGAQAATIAIIDSGNDFNHADLKAKTWINPLEIAGNDRDEDRNGYPDDVNGWNFAESNSSLIDYKYAYSYTEDTKKFFEVQLKFMIGTMTESDRAWIKEKVNDEAFMKKLQIFGNWMHGTHVSGIAAKNASDAKLLGIKLIPTEVKLPGQEFTNEKSQTKDFLIKQALKFLATAQSKTFSEIGAYVQTVKADVANGSFGTPNSAMTAVIATLYKSIFKKEATEQELKTYVDYYFSVALAESKVFVTSAPKTLFVFAAGNEGTNNDIYPTSPANIQATNKIVVAATLYNNDIADFSNFGENTVDVAAPGVGIISQVPMDHMLAVSGTSQAAPYVARVAGLIKDENSKLSPEQIKEIIMSTVDVKDWLKGKVKTSGIVNLERAVRAATLSRSLSLKESILKSKIDVLDQKIPNIGEYNLKRRLSDRELMKKMILPMPSTIVVK